MPPGGGCLRNNVFFPFSCQLEALDAEEAAFFQATSTALAGNRTCSDKSREERDFAIQQIVIRTAVSIEFGDTLKAVGMTRTVIFVRSEEFGEVAPQPRQKNLDLESL